jgi:putative endonuclease
MSKTKKQQLGSWGESQASFFLIRQGYRIVSRNYYTRGGEVDIIAWHDKRHARATLCFIEVKTRSYGLGSAERATGREKQQRLFHAARAYCREHRIHLDFTPIQFEQVSVYVNERTKKIRLKKYVIPVE